jgi:hypothetical protein
MNQQEKESFVFITACIIVVVYMAIMLCGCCHYREYYPCGSLKKEFHGVQFSDKTVNID